MRRKRIYIDLDNTVADYLGMAEDWEYGYDAQYAVFFQK